MLRYLGGGPVGLAAGIAILAHIGLCVMVFA